MNIHKIPEKANSKKITKQMKKPKIKVSKKIRKDSNTKSAQLTKNEENYICKICGKVFKATSGLAYHMRVVHEGFKGMN